MADLLDRVRAEIRERLVAGRAAVDEYERLQTAAAALGGLDAAAQPAEAGRRARAAGNGQRRRQPAATGSSKARAPRGANREAVLRVLSERPGVSAAELAAASGVRRAVLYALLARLQERGEVVKESLPGGATGYSLPREGTAAPSPAPATSPAHTTPEPEPGA